MDSVSIFHCPNKHLYVSNSHTKSTYLCMCLYCKDLCIFAELSGGEISAFFYHGCAKCLWTVIKRGLIPVVRASGLLGRRLDAAGRPHHNRTSGKSILSIDSEPTRV